jgi:predicted nucleotidyltransferase
MDAIENLKTSLTPIFRQYKIQKAILFGSFARGEETRRSDVNLILLQETNKRFFDRYHGLLFDLTNAVKERDVWPLVYTPLEFENMQSRSLIRHAMQESIVIF